MFVRFIPLFRASVVALSLVALCTVASAQTFGDDINQRLDRLENSLRQLTGMIEQLQYRNQQLEQQLNRIQPQQTSPGGAPPAAPAPSGRRSDAFDPGANPGAPGAPRTLGGDTLLSQDQPVGAPGGREAGAPLDLGTSHPPGAVPPPKIAAAPGGLTTAPPSQSPRDTFDMGIGYMQHRDYVLAEQTLRDYLQKYPDHDMVPEAEFWIGESLYQRQRYRDAAEAFLGVTRDHKESAKASDALLRLGQSLAALNEKEAACAAFSEVSRKYPKAAAGVKRGVDAEQKKNRC